LICVVTPKEEEQETADNTGYLEFSWNKTKPVDPGKPKPDDSKKDDNTDKPKPDDSKKDDTTDKPKPDDSKKDDNTDKPKPDDSKKDDNTNKPNDISNRQIKVSFIQIAGISKQIAQGKKVILKAAVYPNTATNKRIIWTSSNPKVATVNANGVVTVKKKTGGKKVTITATATDGSRVSASWKVTSMKGIVKKVKITGAKTVKAGKSLKLKANVTATKKANKKLQWTSSDTKYATINAKGVVKTKKTAKRKTIKITAMATDGSGKKVTFKIKVK
ncbi:MAG: Ig-like domain-containing protein, partial [Anaerobutyricum soehngenii]|nr:Ig-like domain-containing protein [Anaerobutyricum soehngenii]